MGNYNNNNTNTSSSSSLSSYYLCCQHDQPVHPLNNETNLSNTSLTQKLSQLGTFYETVDISNELPQIIKQNLHLHSNTLNTNITNTNTNTFTSKPIQFKNGNIYDGTWNTNIEMEGNGKLFLKEENICVEGLWKSGNFKEGKIYFPNGDIYEGSLEQSLFEGKGTLYFQDGTIYKGNFIKGQRTGNGIQLYPDNSKYIGEFVNGLFHGKGEFTWSCGVVYTGEFVYSQLQGNGVIINTKSKSEYKGMFYKNCFHGKGIYVYGESKAVYNGEYEMGVKKGKGVFIKKDDFVYDGMFDEGKPHGYGNVSTNTIKCNYYWRNGKVIECNNNDNENIPPHMHIKTIDIEDEDIKTNELMYLYRGSFDEFIPTHNVTD